MFLSFAKDLFNFFFTKASFSSYTLLVITIVRNGTITSFLVAGRSINAGLVKGDDNSQEIVSVSCHKKMVKK
jgi:hypothetical protein